MLATASSFDTLLVGTMDFFKAFYSANNYWFLNIINKSYSCLISQFMLVTIKMFIVFGMREMPL